MAANGEGHQQGQQNRGLVEKLRHGRKLAVELEDVLGILVRGLSNFFTHSD
jgi:hypothetical protein